MGHCKRGRYESCVLAQFLITECSYLAFGKHVDGMVFGSGGDVITLKCLSDVTCNNNVIMGIIKGTTSRYDE